MPLAEVVRFFVGGRLVACSRMCAAPARRDLDTGGNLAETAVDNSAPSSPTVEIQGHEDDVAPVLSIDGSCRLCRISGSVACRLVPQISVSGDSQSMANASGVVLSFAGRDFVGIDAIVMWIRLAGGAGERVGALLATRMVYSVVGHCYRFVVRHRHFLG